MLVPLWMWQQGMIREPMFYISDYFEANRDTYYERLLAVSRDGDWTTWCVFFLEAVQSQAEANLGKTKAVLALYDRMKTRVVEVTHSQYAIHMLDWIFERPVFSSTVFVASSGIPSPTAIRLLRVLRDEGVLKPLLAASGRRAAVLAFPELLNLAEGRVVF